MSPPDDHSLDASHAARVEELCRRYENDACSRTDRQFAVLMLFQWVAGIVVAITLSPRTWTGTMSSIHPHLFAAVILGALVNLVPMTLALMLPGRVVTRHIVAVGQSLASALLIHLTGGRIETHFHVFGSLAFLSFYRDWRVLLSATVTVAADHFLRGLYFPESVYGLLNATLWRTLEHAGWVVFEDVFLILSIQQIRRATRELALHQAQAETANRAKSAFLASMSHELRTPLNGVLGMNELLLLTTLTQKQQQFAEASRTSGKLLLQLINDVLDLSKIESGKLELDLHDCSIASVVSEVVEALGPGAAQKSLTLSAHVDPAACVSARCDGNRLRQILVNLVGNAIKFTANGSVTVRAESVPHNGLGLRVRFSVSDTGIGISTSCQERLFAPFMQADCSTARNYGGSGLGLSICKQLVKLMQGEIGIHSQVGQGSTFWFEVPLESPHVTDSAVQTSPHIDVSRSITGHVLVAEDNRINQMFVTELLKNCGCTCDITSNGDEALAALQHHVYDLVLMDCQMPGMDGFTAARAIRLLEANHQIADHHPIIALTANALKGDRERCLAAGMDDYLSKPLEVSQLRAMLTKYLRFPIVTTGIACCQTERPGKTFR